MPTTVEVLAEAFKEAGTPFIVGHPGGESVELMEAARQRADALHPDEAGGRPAPCWPRPGARSPARPGVCLSTRGPGAANMVNGVAHALLDRAPLIAITDPIRGPTYETGLRQRIDQLARLRADRQVEHHDRRQDRAPAGAPRHAHGDRARRRARCSSTCRRARRRARPATTCAEPPLLPNTLAPGPDRADLKPALDMLGARAPADPAGRPRRALGAARRAELVALRRAARRAGADHPEVQGRDPRGPSAARRLHHRRPDRAQARQRRPT